MITHGYQDFLVPDIFHNFMSKLVFAEQIEYLVSGCWITRQGIQPIRNKVEMDAILHIKLNINKKSTGEYAMLLI
jgi:hypothetical protein